MMRHTSFVTSGLRAMLALTLTGSTLTARAAPPQEEEPERPRALGLGGIPFHESGQPQIDPGPALSAPAILPWSRIAFQSFRDFNDWEVYTGNDDGASQSQLTNDGAADIHPRFNRGLTRVVFASDRTGNYEIFSMNADGSGLSQLTFNTTDDVNPAWSPDSGRIAFQAYRDGQAEIYAMNFDGSGQARLTTNADFDGQPMWSPDGTKIAFSSYRSGGYRIWVMNAADGGAQTQLSSQAYSFNPAWSPDGGQIAFDADSDGDGWQELWRMNADGSGQQIVYDPPGTVDASARSWSPDGNYIAFTQISYINIGGVWYWTAAFLDAWDLTSGWFVRLSNVDTDWNPDWQTSDAAAPTTTVGALPAQSPAPINLSWSGSDTGGSGLKSYDVQVKDGSAGAWTDVVVGTTSTSVSYSGVGGHTYYFRVRARDHSSNIEAWPASHDAVTTVEALPPATAVEALPAFSRALAAQGGEIAVRWGGAEPGGSGIQHYDVQYRLGAGGAWTNWLTGTSLTSTLINTLPSLTAGETYYFRSRATDNAQNVEAWPAGDGDTQTTFYRWGLSGTVRDNADTPVSGAALTLAPDSIHAGSSDVDGGYAGYVANLANALTYTAGWAKTGYGLLPTTTISVSLDTYGYVTAPDGQMDVVLPPADNVMQNWDFESGSLGPNWVSGGPIPPSVTGTVKHTGEYGAVLGTHQLFTPGETITTSTTGTSLLFEEDSTGAIHALWADGGYGSQDLFYARRSTNGTWSSPLNLSNQAGVYLLEFDIGVEANGTVHVAWAGAGYDIFYARRSTAGTWSSPQNLTQNPYAYTPQLAVESTGIVHLVWTSAPAAGGLAEIYYARRDGAGVWSAAQNVSNNAGSSSLPKIALGTGGILHVTWADDTSSSYSSTDVFYSRRDSNGAWSSPQNISNAPNSYSAQLAVDGTGVAHVVWIYPIGGAFDLRYARRDTGGAWSSPINVAPNIPTTSGDAPEPRVSASSAGVFHLVWQDGNYAPHRSVYYIQRSAAGSWSGLFDLSQDEYGARPHLALSADGLAHVVWAGRGLMYSRQGTDGAWSVPQPVVPESSEPAAVLLRAGPAVGVQLVWSGPLVSSSGLHYMGPATVSLSGDSSVSQVVTVANSLSTPTLSFLYQLGGGAPASPFNVRVDNGLASTLVYSASTNTAGWTHGWADLSAWKGQTVTVTLKVNEIAGKLHTWAYVDEVSLGSTYPDVWVDTSGTPAGLPGKQVTFAITYGNQGGAPASGVTITHTLPAQLVFVSASVPPVSTSPALVWNAGSVGAETGPLTIVVTATVSAGATLYSTLTSTTDIDTASVELENANNADQFATFVGQRFYLPLALR